MADKGVAGTGFASFVEVRNLKELVAIGGPPLHGAHREIEELGTFDRAGG